MTVRTGISGRPSAGWMVSIRLRLTLWNVGVVMLILLGMGVTLRYALQATLISNVDHDLEHGIQHLQRIVDHRGSLPPPLEDGLGTPKGEVDPHIFDLQGRIVPGSPGKDAGPYNSTGFRSAIKSGQPTFVTLRWHGQNLRVLSFPLRVKQRVAYIVEFPRPLAETEAEVSHLTRLLILLAGPAALLAGIGGAFLTNRALRPVRQITHAAARIEAEDLSRRLDVAGRDELSELAGTFNGMLARLDEAFAQRKSAYERMEKAYEQQQRFTADASHELKSPLTVIEGTVSLNLSGRERTSEQYRKALGTIGRSAGMMTRIVQDLLLLAQSDAGHLTVEMRPLSVFQVMCLARDSVADSDEPEAARTMPPIVLASDTLPDLFVCGDPTHLTRLLVNVLENARRHTPVDGMVMLSATGDAGTVTIGVADTGIGISAEDLEHVFDRFYRVDSARARAHGGTGLGLAIGRSIAEAHGGSLEIESVLGEGTTVKLRLPKLADA